MPLLEKRKSGMNKPKFTFRRTPDFRKDFAALSSEDKRAAKELFLKFRKCDNPFQFPGVHRIHRLSALYKTTVYSGPIRPNLRFIFILVGSEIRSVGIGTHAIYG